MNADDMQDAKQDPDTQELKGHVEETVGQVFGDDDLVAHGRADQLAAHAKQAATQAGEAARNVGQRLKDSAMQKLGELHERLHEATDGHGDSGQNGHLGEYRQPEQPAQTHDPVPSTEPIVTPRQRQSPETSEDR